MSKSKKVDLARSPSKRKDFIGSEDILAPSLVNSTDINLIRKKYNIPGEVHHVLPPSGDTANSVVEGYCCMYEMWLEECGLRFSIHPLLLDFLEALEMAIPQICLKFVRMIHGFIFLVEENVVHLTVNDILRLTVVKADAKCFGGSPN